MIRHSASSDDAILFGGEFIDANTIKAQLLWVDQQMCRRDLEFTGLGCLRLPEEALGHPSSCLLTDATLVFTSSIT